jgi:hypothetical protein
VPLKTAGIKHGGRALIFYVAVKIGLLLGADEYAN